MKIFKFFIFTVLVGGSFMFSACNRGGKSEVKANHPEMTEEQKDLVANGLYLPKTAPDGELSEEYGVNNRYGQQDNYFDIEVGSGMNIAVKIIDVLNDECVRYVYIPGGTTVIYR